MIVATSRYTGKRARRCNRSLRYPSCLGKRTNGASDSNPSDSISSDLSLCFGGLVEHCWPAQYDIYHDSAAHDSMHGVEMDRGAPKGVQVHQTVSEETSGEEKKSALIGVFPKWVESNVSYSPYAGVFRGGS